MNKLDKDYQELLKDILENGVEKMDRTGTGILSVFGRQIRHKMSNGFPLLTTKKMAWNSIVTELLWFLRGDTNIKYLIDKKCHIWDGDCYKYYKEHVKFSSNAYDRKIISVAPIDDLMSNFKIGDDFTKDEFIEKIKTDDNFAKRWGDLGKIYGYQWRKWGANEDNLKNGIDQIQNLINDLKTNPDSRRLMVSAWNVSEIKNVILPPCHYGFQCYTRELDLKERSDIAESNYYEVSVNIKSIGIDEDEKIHKLLDDIDIPRRGISLMWNQRSCDVFLGIPFNIASYGLLLEIIANEVNMVPDELIGNFGDTHLYLNHIDQAKEQISREPMNLPKLLFSDEYWYLNDIDVSFSEKIEKFKLDFFKIDNYQYHPVIKAPLSN